MRLETTVAPPSANPPEQAAADALPPLREGYRRHILAEPVVVTEGDEQRTITFVDMRMKVKGKDMRATDAATGPIAKQMVLISRLIGLPTLVIDEMDHADVMALMEMADDPTSPGRPTGSAPSA